MRKSLRVLTNEQILDFLAAFPTRRFMIDDHED